LDKRPMLSKEKVLDNLKNYKKNIGKILDLKKTKFVYNSKWLAKLNFHEIAELAESFTVQQMLARRNFKDRYEKGEEISLREFLYPLLQGYDSVQLKADIEIGGFDQLFNLKAGRVIQKYYGQPEQDVLTYQMLEGTDGRKMSTSWGNVINITDEPNDMYGKIMSLRDDLIIKYFTLCTDLEMSEIKEIGHNLKQGANPRDIKMRLALEIVALYHGKKEADKAQAYFISVFQKKENPDEAQKIQAQIGDKLIDILLTEKVVSSKTDFRRLIDNGAIKINGEEKITDPAFVIKKSCLIKVGKHRFVSILV
ncbi:MAG: tyrosine--tRNA ligase, partial [Candidatus Vogelbacteria bacterium]|nr:tyrosine--tRNA ligase [Candidatus Vogelbacteria bacterium]